VLLIVNVASKCGFTPQYNGLQSLYELFQPRGFSVVGATGPTGIHLVTELRKTVASVRVIACSMHKLARLFPEATPVEKWPGRCSRRRRNPTRNRRLRPRLRL